MARIELNIEHNGMDVHIDVEADRPEKALAQIEAFLASYQYERIDVVVDPDITEKIRESFMRPMVD